MKLAGFQKALKFAFQKNFRRKDNSVKDDKSTIHQVEGFQFTKFLPEYEDF